MFNLNSASNVFMLGIGGSGMRGLAFLLKNQKKLYGSDQRTQDILNDRNLSGIKISSEAQAAHLIKRADLLVYSDAAPANHPLRQQAYQLNITQISFIEAVAQLSTNYDTLCIAGTHGKSSTTAIVAHLAITGKLDPTVIIGAAVPDWQNRNARQGKSNFFIIEADEYRDHFLALKPKYVILTTIDFDHPDYFRSLAHTKKSYNSFLQKIPPDGWLVTHRAIIDNHPDIIWPANTYAVNETAIDNLPISGKHMRENAALAIKALQLFGLNKRSLLTNLTFYQGLRRRSESIGYYQQIEILSDYGHHPVEITATLSSLKEQHPYAQILSIFEPHTLDRLKRFNKLFIAALSGFAGVICGPVFIPPGRESQSITAQREITEFASSLRKVNPNTWQATNLDNTANLLKEHIKRFDLVIIFSAGHMDSYFRAFIERTT